MHLFNEKGMKGGISCIAKRHSKANNKYMNVMIVVKFFDPVNEKGIG